MDPPKSTLEKKMNSKSKNKLSNKEKREKKYREKERSLNLRKERGRRDRHVTQMFSEAAVENVENQADTAENTTENKDKN